VPLYAFTIFLSAFLLFLVQPMLAKFILPWFGGSPAVWSTCMLFFQALLLLGYAYAHALVRLAPRRQAWLHLLLLAAALALLPVTPAESWKEGAAASPTARILSLLTISVGAPYLALSATGPLLQAWFARRWPSRSPYRLYALSNAGSLLALFAYPALVETTLRLHVQTLGWSLAFGCFALLCAWVTWRARLSAPLAAGAGSAGDAAEAAPGARRIAAWILLPGLASLLLLASTNQICQDVASVPFLWVLPLGLYLTSFILCFAYEERDFGTWFGGLSILAVPLAAAALRQGPALHLGVQLGVHAATLFCVCMACHGLLVRMRPGPRWLTGFYLALSLGGVLGGAFVALLAPRLFDDFWEYPLGLLLGFGLGAWTLARETWPASGSRARALRLGGVLLLCGLLAAELDRGLGRAQRSSFLTVRDFYGVFRVADARTEDPAQHKRWVWSGLVAHGLQYQATPRRRWASGYHGRQSGVGLAALHRRAPGASLRMGVVGLGAGALAAYAEPGDALRFYEISPSMAEIAEDWFSFLADARQRGAQVSTVLGDARLELEAELAAGRPGGFDLLVIDAFTGDAVPMHLLTREAFQVYRAHLADGGIIAVNVSNIHIDFDPVLRGLAEALGMAALRVSTDEDPALGQLPARWWLLADRPAALEIPAVRRAADPASGGRRLLWTDDFSSLFGVLR
jgi:hypothetical protein